MSVLNSRSAADTSAPSATHGSSESVSRPASSGAAVPSQQLASQGRALPPGASSIQVQLAALRPGAGGYGQQAQALQPDSASAREVALSGIGSGGPLPHLGAIQKSFGAHDVSGIRAHTGEAAQAASMQLGARGYATADNVVLGAGTTDLHTVAHEAAHVIQQRGGQVQLYGGVGREGDRWERHADAVADAVVGGRSAEGLLNEVASPQHGATASGPVQRKIELVDTDAAVYQETDQQKTDHGELYYTDKNVDPDTPIFVGRDIVDGINDQLSEVEGKPNYKQAEALLLMSALHNKTPLFVSDKGVVNPSQPEHLLRRALYTPYFKDPNKRTGGLRHRFPDAAGNLISWVRKDVVEARLGAKLPDSVRFHKLDKGEFQQELTKWRGHWTIEGRDYAYARMSTVVKVEPRADRSKARYKNQSKVDPDDQLFKGDTLKASLPKSTGNAVDSGWIDHKALSHGRDRGKGQFKAMGDWNALGYAAYMKHHGHDDLNTDTDWEWLHVRGAQNGGATDATNLVAGTSSTNSRMIPAEDKINKWTANAKPTTPLSVRYTATKRSGTFIGDEIQIEVAAPAGLPGVFPKIPKENPAKWKFVPTDATVFDDITERIVRTERVDAAMQEVADFKKGDEYTICKGPYKGWRCTIQLVRGDQLTVHIGALGRREVLDRSFLRPVQN